MEIQKEGRSRIIIQFTRYHAFSVIIHAEINATLYSKHRSVTSSIVQLCNERAMAKTFCKLVKAMSSIIYVNVIKIDKIVPILCSFTKLVLN